MQARGITNNSAQQQMMQMVNDGHLTQQELNGFIEQAKQIGQMLGLPL